MSVTATATPQTREPAAPEPASGRYYVLVVLSLLYALNFLDRNVISILIEPIKHELHASDTAMGALAGFAFVLMYATVGMPIARWADRHNRRNLISVGVAVWSVFTVVSGLAVNFLQLAVARVGVGIGEAAGAPPSHSLISDYFPKEQRARAISIFQSSIYVGMAGGYIIGGWVSQFYGWRAAFFVAGIPGLLLALLVRFTVTEPKRGNTDRHASPVSTPRVGEVIQFMIKQRAFLLVVLALGIVAFTNYAFSVWSPSLLRRMYHLSGGQIGTYLGLIKAPAGILGTVLGGFIVDRIVKTRDQRWRVWLPAIATVLVCPLWIAFALVNNLAVGLLCLAIGNVLVGIHLGPFFGLVQNLAKAPMRALSSAAAFMFIALLGTGMGPLTVGILSDSLRGRFAAASIRYALVGVSTACVLGAVVMLLAGEFLRSDLSRCED